MAGSVTMLIHSLRSSEDRDVKETAAEKLWHTFYPRLCSKLNSRGGYSTTWDEEDVASKALGDLLVSVQSPGKQNDRREIKDRTELWRLLSVIASRQIKDNRRRDSAVRRGGETKTASLNSEPGGGQPSVENCPYLHAAVAEQCDRLINSLQEPRLKTAAGMKIRGFTTAEIANELECSPRTVKSMVKRIKTIWIAISDE